jgi:hypothetical protein
MKIFTLLRMLSVAIKPIMASVIMPSFTMKSVIMLSVTNDLNMTSVIMLSVTTKTIINESPYTEFHFDECH